MNFRKGRMPFVIFVIIPDSCAISISPIHSAMTPAVIIAPALVATLFSTIISVIYCKWKDR